MPEVFRYHGYRFFFYSNEGSPREPMHVHVGKGDFEAKFWIEPAAAVAYSDGFDARTLRELVGLVSKNRDRIRRARNEYFG